MNRLIISLVLILGLPLTTYAKPLTLEQIIEATCRIKSSSGTGTGTVIKKTIPFNHKGTNYPAGYFIQTNAHVVGNNQTVNLEFFRKGFKSNSISGKVIWRRYHDRKAIDIALIWIPQSIFTEDNKPGVIPLAPADYILKKGQKIRGAGCPQGGWPQAWVGHILTPYLSSGATEFLLNPIGGQSGTGITVDIPDSNGELYTKVAILLSWSDENNGAGLSNRLIHKIRLGQVISNNKLPDTYQKLIKPTVSINKSAKLPNCAKCGHRFREHTKKNGLYYCPKGICPNGSCNPFEWFGGGGGQQPNPGNGGGGQDPAPWPDPPGGEDPVPDPQPDPNEGKITELEAKIKELTDEYNRIKNDLSVSVIDKNKLIAEIVGLKKQLDIEKDANTGLSGQLINSNNNNRDLTNSNKHLDKNNTELKSNLTLSNTDIKSKLSIIGRLKEKLIHPLDTLTKGNGVWLERLSFLGAGGLFGALGLYWRKRGKEKLTKIVDKFTDAKPGIIDDIIIDRVLWPRAVKLIDKLFAERGVVPEPESNMIDTNIPSPFVIPTAYKTVVNAPPITQGMGPVHPEMPGHKYTQYDFIYAIDEFAERYKNDPQYSIVKATLYKILETPKRAKGG